MISLWAYQGQSPGGKTTGVGAGPPVGVLVGVGVTRLVGVRVGVFVGVEVTRLVGVLVGVFVGVGVTRLVGLLVGVGVTVGVFVAGALSQNLLPVSTFP